jgi:hypothetical protein
MVAAAGNYTLVVVYPAAYPRVMAVGATDDRDQVPWWVPGRTLLASTHPRIHYSPSNIPSLSSRHATAMRVFEGGACWHRSEYCPINTMR